MSGYNRTVAKTRAVHTSEDAKSRLVRLSLGIYTPGERQAFAETQKRRQEAAQKKAQAGIPLGLEEEP